MEITFEGGQKVVAHINGHKIITDQPVNAGGENSAPSPFELFLASIGTCAGIFVKLFCDKRRIPTENIKLKQEVVYNNSGLPEEINIQIIVPEDFPENYKSAIINSAELCKVKKSIALQPKFSVKIANKQKL